LATLYELTSDFLQVQQMIEDGVEGLEDTLESINLALEDKLENIGKVIRNLESEVNQFKEEEKRLADKRKAIENNIKRLKDYAEQSMIATGNKKLKTGIFTFAIQKNPPSINVVDEKLIPKKYFVPVDPKLDKKSIQQSIKDGELVPGVQLIQREGLRIR